VTSKHGADERILNFSVGLGHYINRAGDGVDPLAWNNSHLRPEGCAPHFCSLTGTGVTPLPMKLVCHNGLALLPVALSASKA